MRWTFENEIEQLFELKKSKTYSSVNATTTAWSVTNENYHKWTDDLREINNVSFACSSIIKHNRLLRELLEMHLQRQYHST